MQAAARWTITDRELSDSETSRLNIARLMSLEGEVLDGVDAFTLQEQIHNLDSVGLVVVANVCRPSSYKRELNRRQMGGLGKYASIVYQAVRTVTPRAMLFMTMRRGDLVADDIKDGAVKCCSSVLVSKLATLPFDWTPVACNHADAQEYPIGNAKDQIVYVSPGGPPSMCDAVFHRKSSSISLIEVLNVAVSDGVRVLWLAERDCALSCGCALHLSDLVNLTVSPTLAMFPPRVEQNRFWLGWPDDLYSYQQFKEFARQQWGDDMCDLIGAILWAKAKSDQQQ